ncbi:hypothetical protein CN331_04920 [Bacillus cereus]|uniref:hypothetical protein n=1 Tax=Bacillus cereus TaxID=1396 RepID=UPI000BF28A74|nr:hypothetical protein [Bacillus cereus]PEW64649.1 hypothetical protein CN443_03125 [Bacillus cereus]PEY23801.1 hypothetical protein CN331_04920 [Bacillus cereus]
MPFFDDFIGGTIESFAKQAKDELKKLEIKDVTDLIVKLEDILPGGNITSDIEEIQNVLEQSQKELEQQDISTEKLTEIVIKASKEGHAEWSFRKMEPNGWYFNVPPEVVITAHLYTEYKKLVADKDIEVCSMIVSAGLILLAAIYRTYGEHAIPYAEKLTKSAIKLGTDMCVARGG